LRTKPPTQWRHYLLSRAVAETRTGSSTRPSSTAASSNGRLVPVQSRGNHGIDRRFCFGPQPPIEEPAAAAAAAADPLGLLAGLAILAQPRGRPGDRAPPQLR